MLTAQKQIIIVGWDVDSRTLLPSDVAGIETLGECDEPALTLGSFLESLLRAKPELKVSILSWDFPVIYAFEREALTWLRFGSSDVSERLRFVLDREHPALASHHQKIIVVDDRLAFSGGLDLTQRRWDTTEHRGHDSRRVDPGGHCYGPFHDVQMIVDGEAAAALGDLVRERWFAATEEVLDVPVVSGEARWPESSRLDFRDVEIGISRTVPARFENGHLRRPIREVERLFVDSIREARRTVYIENQYFTSKRIARALARRLKEPNGPEIVMVLPRDQTGFIEESTMGLLRSEALRLVLASDLQGRFRCFYPVVSGIGSGYLKVHSKVMIIDDCFVRVGSANLNSRSMGLDTECDLAIDARDRADLVQSMRDLRFRLLAEHLGVGQRDLSARERETGSMCRAVDSLRGGDRTLVPLGPHVPRWVSRFLPPVDWIDPARPWGIRRWFSKRLMARPVRAVLKSFALAFALVFLVGGASLEAASPYFTQLEPRTFWGALGPREIAAQLEAWRGESWAGPAVVLAFVAATAVFIPINAMFLAIAFLFSRFEALAISLTSGMLSALLWYFFGRSLGRAVGKGSSRGFNSRFLSHKRLETIEEAMADGGALAMAAVRLVPIAPYSIVGIAAGLLQVPVINYLVGTFIGLLPGLCLVALLAGGGDPHALPEWTRLIGVILFLIVVAFLIPKMVSRLGLRKKGGA